jgi:hypothetical protein
MFCVCAVYRGVGLEVVHISNNKHLQSKAYKLGTVCMSSILNPPLQELDLVPASFLLFFLFKYTLCTVVDDPQTNVP